MNYYYPGYQAYNRTTSNNIVLTKIYCEKIQAKDLTLLPAERKQPQIDKQIKILHMLEKKVRSDNERTLASIYDKNSAAA
jgi:hypothetical protein